MAKALLDSPASSRTVPLDTVAAWFGKWLHSPPFDIGSTTGAALSAARGNPVVEGMAARMQAAAAQHNQNSLSNGCLLRLTPLAIWSSRQPTDVVAANAAAETSLTHPQQTAQVASAAYCIVIAHLINHSKDAQGAIAAANTWLQNGLAAALQQVTPPGGTHSSTSGGSASSAQPGSQASCEHDVSADSAADVKPKAAAAWEAVLSWLGEAQQDGPGPEVYRAAGFMKWGFVHAFRALALTLPFEEALRQLHGGDKNTNAVIVGGLLGAYWGAEGISATLTGPVLCRCSSSVGIKRPEFLQTGQLPELFEKLWAAASS
ncbi:ADP-ribosylation/Crystallin J1 [Scenedesmus sp. NREL 46B-D3]|nr:ADP-ribosylation/Crystallin J1 [Scenedesmus sp. NREL 46B-D3]